MDVAGLWCGCLIKTGKHRGGADRSRWHARSGHCHLSRADGCRLRCKELLHDREGFCWCVLEHPVTHVGEAMCIGLRPGLEETLQAIGAEAPIAHSPHQTNRQARERWQIAFDSCECLPGFFSCFCGDIAHEAVHGPTIRP